MVYGRPESRLRYDRFRPHQMGDFEVATTGGFWVAVGDFTDNLFQDQELGNHNLFRTKMFWPIPPVYGLA